MSVKNFCFIALATIIMVLCSCGKHRYLQAAKGTAQQDSLYKKTFEEYKVQPNDILNINIAPVFEQYSTLFSTAPQSVMSIPEAYFYLTGYHIDINGQIELPVVGKINVAGLTVVQIQETVKKKISELVYDAQIIVRLVSFRVSIIGEVQRPGDYTIYRDQANIFQVLAMAGDANYYANRKKVMIYRASPEGTTAYSIDLTHRESLSSPYFYLQPNDVVYLQPLPRTLFRVTVSDFMTYLSVITTSVTLVIAILTLSK